MKQRHLALPCLACAVALATVASGAPKSPHGHATAASTTAPAKKPAATKSPAPAKAPRAPAGPTLSDSTVLARVDDRKVLVADFNDAYFASDPQYRPHPDSLGRVEFLNSMVNKEVLGITAL